jgi:hypothetical protein
MSSDTMQEHTRVACGPHTPFCERVEIAALNATLLYRVMHGRTVCT